jgi:hypothetical protein
VLFRGTATRRSAEIEKEGPVPRLSIVIPCRGGAAEFDATLVSVLQNRPADSEVLVVHTAAYDDPYDLRGEVNFLQESAEQTARLINAGLREAQGELVLVVGCGLEIVEGGLAAALAQFRDPDVASVTPLVVTPEQSLVAAGVYWSWGGRRQVASDRRLLLPGSARLRSKILGPTLAAGLYRRAVLDALQGFDESVGDGLADVELALAIRALGRLNVCEPALRLVASQPLEATAVTGFAHGRGAERLFWRYGPSLGDMTLHPVAVLADLAKPGGAALARAGAVAGRLAALAEAALDSSGRRRLEAAAERLAAGDAPPSVLIQERGSLRRAA